MRRCARCGRRVALVSETHLIDHARACVFRIEHAEPFPIECTATAGWIGTQALGEIAGVELMVRRWNQVQLATIEMKGPVPAVGWRDPYLNEYRPRPRAA